jgi:hypothetical protein
MLSVVYADRHTKAPYAECDYAQCGHAECHYAECRGASVLFRLNHKTLNLNRYFQQAL